MYLCFSVKTCRVELILYSSTDNFNLYRNLFSLSKHLSRVFPFLLYQQLWIEPLLCWTVNKDSALFRHVNNGSRSGKVKRNPITWFNSVNTFCVRERSKQKEFPSQTHFKNGPDHGPWIISFKTEKRKQMALGNSLFFFFPHLTTRFSTLTGIQAICYWFLVNFCAFLYLLRPSFKWWLQY